MTRLAATFEAHEDGVVRWFSTRIANGLLEGLSSLVQAAKARARGYPGPGAPETPRRPGSAAACPPTAHPSIISTLVRIRPYRRSPDPPDTHAHHPG